MLGLGLSLLWSAIFDVTVVSGTPTGDGTMDFSSTTSSALIALLEDI